jgi:hypothetical protein
MQSIVEGRRGRFLRGFRGPTEEFLGLAANAGAIVSEQAIPMPMSRVLGSGWFLVSTAACCAIGVGFTSWIAYDSSAGVRAIAALIGLAAGLGVMLLVAWVLASEPQPERAPQPEAQLAAPVEAAESESTAVIPRADLTALLEGGLELRRTIEPGASDERVGAWIAEVRRSLEHGRPGVLGYYDALAARTFADDRDRLEAHLDRLATIVGDFI